MNWSKSFKSTRGLTDDAEKVWEEEKSDSKLLFFLLFFKKGEKSDINSGVLIFAQRQVSLLTVFEFEKGKEDCAKEFQ